MLSVMFSDFVLEKLSSCLYGVSCRFEITQVSAASKTTLSSFVKNRQDLFGLLENNKWMNYVMFDCRCFHMFINRLTVNVPDIDKHFHHGLYGIDLIMKTYNFITLDTYPLCGFCSASKVDAAVYYSVGENIVTSTPYLMFGCADCVREKFGIDDEYYYDYYYDYYHPPIITIFKNSKKSNVQHDDRLLDWSPLY